VKTPGAGCFVGGDPFIALHRVLFWDSGKPTLAAVRKGDRQKGVEILRLIEPQRLRLRSKPAPTKSWPPFLENVSSGPFLDTTAARAHPARVPDCLLQPTLWHQRHPYFAPRIFELTGLGAKAALLQSVGIA